MQSVLLSPENQEIKVNTLSGHQILGTEEDRSRAGSGFAAKYSSNVRCSRILINSG